MGNMQYVTKDLSKNDLDTELPFNEQIFSNWQTNLLREGKILREVLVNKRQYLKIRNWKYGEVPEQVKDTNSFKYQGVKIVYRI